MKWEYAEEFLSKNLDPIHWVLQPRGNEGWELITVIVTGNKLQFFFKRPIVSSICTCGVSQYGPTAGHQPGCPAAPLTNEEINQRRDEIIGKENMAAPTIIEENEAAGVLSTTYESEEDEPAGC